MNQRNKKKSALAEYAEAATFVVTTISVIAAAVFAGTLGALWVLDTGLDRQERHECLTWALYAQKYPNFYLRDFEAEQCEAIGLPVDARIIHTH